MAEKKQKFNAVPTIIDGIRFASKAEGQYYLFLKAEKEAGRIRDFKRQQRLEIIPKHKKFGKPVAARSYIADFIVTRLDGEEEIIDVKGFETKEFKLKKVFFEYLNPEKSIKIVSAKDIKGWSV